MEVNVFTGMKLCCEGEDQLSQRFMQLKIEALIRSGGQQNADEALEILSQVLQLVCGSLETRLSSLSISGPFQRTCLKVFGL